MNREETKSISYLESLAIEFENKAKNENNDFIKKASLHYKAAKIREKLGDTRSFKWNMANYHSSMGQFFLSENKFKTARTCLKRAEKLFLEINVIKSAFYCARKCIKTFILEIKESGKKFPRDEYFEYLEMFLDRYKDFAKNGDYKLMYLEEKISYYKFLSIRDRLSGDFSSAEIWAEKCFQTANQAYIRYKKESLQKAVLYNKHMYWNLKARRFKAEEKYKEAAKFYLLSAEIVSKFDEKVAYDEYSNAYMCYAMANKADLKEFEKWMKKSITCAKKSGDEKKEHYLIGFFYEFKAKNTQNLEERIKYIRKAKEHYYKSYDESLGKLMEFLLYYYLSQKGLQDGNYKQALNYLDKAINLAEYVKFPNILNSMDDIKSERLLYQSYLNLSQGKLTEAIQDLDNWLNKQKGIENTRKYQFYKITKFCLEILNNEELSFNELRHIEEIISFVRENNLDPPIHNICSLTYSYASLWINNIRVREVLDEIRLKIISQIVREEAVEELKRRMEVQHAVEKIDWILRLPPKLAEAFDKCLYAYNNSLETFKRMAVRDFYLLIENFLKIIVEFNSKVVWLDDWRTKLEKLVVNDNKRFEKFTFGDLIVALEILRKENKTLCKNLSGDIFEFLKKHTEIRNKLAHELEYEMPPVNIVDEVLKIMYLLLSCFPMCIRIIDDKRKPWYDAELIWNRYPKRIMLYSEKTLQKELYYIEPILEISDEREISPKVIIPASCCIV